MVHLWKEFGLALGQKPPTLESIQSSNNYTYVEKCFTEVLAAWLNENKSPHSSGHNWVEVIAALKSPSVNMDDHAHKLVHVLAGIGKCIT